MSATTVPHEPTAEGVSPEESERKEEMEDNSTNDMPAAQDASVETSGEQPSPPEGVALAPLLVGSLCLLVALGVGLALFTTIRVSNPGAWALVAIGVVMVTAAGVTLAANHRKGS